MFISREDKPKVQVGVVENMKEMDRCLDRGKYLQKLALDSEISHLLKALKKKQKQKNHPTKNVSKVRVRF